MKVKLKDLLFLILIVTVYIGLIWFVSSIIAKGITKAKAETTVYSIEMSPNMIDLRKVNSFYATETGLYLNISDSEGYYLEVPNKTETNYVYVICDVVASYGECPEDIYATNLLCEMPDGTLHVYQIEDAPEGKVELVCFQTSNQDNYETYEVVAVR